LLFSLKGNYKIYNSKPIDEDLVYALMAGELSSRGTTQWLKFEPFDEQSSLSNTVRETFKNLLVGVAAILAQSLTSDTINSLIKGESCKLILNHQQILEALQREITRKKLAEQDNNPTYAQIDNGTVIHDYLPDLKDLIFDLSPTVFSELTKNCVLPHESLSGQWLNRDEIQELYKLECAEKKLGCPQLTNIPLIIIGDGEGQKNVVATINKLRADVQSLPAQSIAMVILYIPDNRHWVGCVINKKAHASPEYIIADSLGGGLSDHVVEQAIHPLIYGYGTRSIKNSQEITLTSKDAYSMSPAMTMPQSLPVNDTISDVDRLQFFCNLLSVYPRNVDIATMMKIMQETAHFQVQDMKSLIERAIAIAMQEQAPSVLNKHLYLALYLDQNYYGQGLLSLEAQKALIDYYCKQNFQVQLSHIAIEDIAKKASQFSKVGLEKLFQMVKIACSFEQVEKVTPELIEKFAKKVISNFISQANTKIASDETTKSTLYIPEETLKDVIGVPAEIKRLIAKLKEPHLYDNQLIPRYLLLHGPSGTGKSLLARAIAGETKRKLSYLTSANIVNKYQGSGAAAIRQLFEDALELDEPVVVWIDELDGITSEGDNSNSNNKSYLEARRVLYDYLDRENSNIFFIGTTNHLDKIDTTIIDRFRTATFKIDLLNQQDREALLRHYFEKEQVQVGPDLITKCAQHANQLTQRVIEETVKNSVDLARERSKDSSVPLILTEEDFYTAICCCHNKPLKRYQRVQMLKHYIRQQNITMNQDIINKLAMESGGLTARDLEEITNKVVLNSAGTNQISQDNLFAVFIHGCTSSNPKKIPNETTRQMAINFYLRNKQHNLSSDFITRLAGLTHSFKGSEMEAVFQKVARIAEWRKSTTITQDDFYIAYYSRRKTQEVNGTEAKRAILAYYLYSKPHQITNESLVEFAQVMQGMTKVQIKALVNGDQAGAPVTVTEDHLYNRFFTTLSNLEKSEWDAIANLICESRIPISNGMLISDKVILNLKGKKILLDRFVKGIPCPIGVSATFFDYMLANTPQVTFFKFYAACLCAFHKNISRELIDRGASFAYVPPKSRPLTDQEFCDGFGEYGIKLYSQSSSSCLVM
jgi:AAA+ superfamily predicted ATPase